MKSCKKCKLSGMTVSTNVLMSVKAVIKRKNAGAVGFGKSKKRGRTTVKNGGDKMNAEILKKIGLTDEQAEEILKLHKETLDGSYVPKSRFNEVNEENKSLKAAISERDRQLDELKKSEGDIETLRKTITELQRANLEAEMEHDKQIMQMRMDIAIEAMLREAGAKNVRAVRALLDESSLRLMEDGTVYGLAEALKAVQISDPYLFREDRPAPRGMKCYQPECIDARATPDISHMTYSQYIAAGGQ